MRTGSDLEYRTAIVSSALTCRAVQVTLGIGNQTGPGNGSIRAISTERIQDCLLMRTGSDLEYRTAIVSSALTCRAVQVTLGIGNQTGPGNGSIRAVSTERIQDSLRMGPRRDFEYRTLTIRPTT